MSIVLGTTRLLERFPWGGPSPVLPVTLAEFKQHAQVQHNVEDAVLTEFLLDAIEYVEMRGRVSLIHQRVRHVLDCWPGGQTVHISRGPLVSVQSVGYLDADHNEQAAPASTWRADTRSRWGGVFFSDSFSETLDTGDGVVWADVTCGYGETADKVPSQWKHLICVIAKHSYERRELATGGNFDDAFDRVLRRRFSVAGQAMRYA